MTEKNLRGQPGEVRPREERAGQGRGGKRPGERREGRKGHGNQQYFLVRWAKQLTSIEVTYSNNNTRSHYSVATIRLLNTRQSMHILDPVVSAISRHWF